MNKKQIYILLLAGIAFVLCILFNFRGLISLYFSNAASITTMIDTRPMLVELVILAIIFGSLLIRSKTPKKRG